MNVIWIKLSEYWYKYECLFKERVNYNSVKSLVLRIEYSQKHYM